MPKITSKNKNKTPVAIIDRMNGSRSAVISSLLLAASAIGNGV
jgi:hypothetical protein